MARKRFVVWERLPALLTSEDVCQILGIHDNTLINYRKQGRIRMKKIGRSYQMDRDALRAWIEDNGVTSVQSC